MSLGLEQTHNKQNKLKIMITKPKPKPKCMPRVWNILNETRTRARNQIITKKNNAIPLQKPILNIYYSSV